MSLKSGHGSSSENATSQNIISTSSQADVIELSSMNRTSSTQQPTPQLEAQTPPPNPPTPIPRLHLKLFSAAFSFFVAGTNDGSTGALLPYILHSYNLNPSQIALLYLTNFLGWLLAALTNPHLPHYLPLRSLLLLGATLQTLSHSLRPWHPPFPLYALTFFLSGLGQAYQDSHANTFVSSAPKYAHNWLGFIHAAYGFGCLVAPFIATAIAGRGEGMWMLFYYFPLGLCVINVVLTGVAFRGGSYFLRRVSGQDEGEEDRGRGKNAMREIKQMMKIRNIWLISLFFFFHLGVCFTASGWVVQYLTETRNAPLSTTGYIPSGFYGGILLGRLLLSEPTHRFGEFRMLLLYTGLCFAMQMVFWFVPGLVGSAVAFGLMGFLLGPGFAAGVSVASRILPGYIQSSALGLIFVIAQAGGAIFPSVIGLIATHAGVKVLQPIVAGLIVVMGITWAFVPKPKVESRLE